jgi:hypothetical protein
MRNNEVLVTKIIHKPRNDDQVMFPQSFTISANRNSEYGPSIHIQKGTSLHIKPRLVVRILSILLTYIIYHVYGAETH